MLNCLSLLFGQTISNFGEGAWHELAIGNSAEAAGELAYSIDKAEPAKIEETSFIGGPSLEILAKHLDKATADKLIPYAPTMGAYMTADEAASPLCQLQGILRQSIIISGWVLAHTMVDKVIHD